MEERSGLTLAQAARAVVVVVILAAVLSILYSIRGTLLPFAMAFILSYILVPVVDYLEARRVNRLAGTAFVLATLILVGVVSIVTFVPVLVSGMADMKDRILGDRPTWSCIILNQSVETVAYEAFESTTQDFTIVTSELPVELPPGGQDTLHIQYAPRSGAPVFGTLALIPARENVRPLVFWLSGNASSSESTMRPGTFVLPGAGRVAVTDSAHAFGPADPGYVSQLRSQIEALQPRIEQAFPQLQGLNLANEASVRLQAAATQILRDTPALLGTVVSGLTFLVIVPLVLFFFLAEGRTIKRKFIEVIPNAYFEMVLNLIYRIDQQLGGYIRGIVLSVVIVSMLSMAGLRVVGLRDYLVVGTVAGVANVIPYLGPLIGIIAGTIAAVLQYSVLSWTAILPVVLVFLVVQILDNVVIQPFVVARSVNLHPLLVIFVVLVGSQLFGAVGMLLAVPLTAVLKVSIQTVYEGLRSYSLT